MKKKKICFIIFGLLIILLSLISIMGADASRESMLKLIESFPDIIQDRMIAIYSNNAVFIIPSVLCIILNIIFLINVFWGKIEVHRNLLLGLSIATFLFSPNTLVAIMAVVNIVISITIKAEKIEKKGIPSLERYDAGSKGIIFAILCLALYFSNLLIKTTDNVVINYIIAFSFYIVVFAFCLFAFKDNLKRDFKVFRENFRNYLSFAIVRIAIVYVIYVVLSFVCIFVFKKGISINEQQVESLPLWYSLPLAVVWAPIVEEILFRGCLRRFIKNDIVFIIISGVIFGFLHTMSEADLLSAIVIAIPYGILGSGLAYIYSKTNNICNNILWHSCHNAFTILLQILVF